MFEHVKATLLALLCLWCLENHGVSSDDPEILSVTEGDSVTLNIDVETDQREKIKWYYNGDRIAQINGHHNICTDPHCERFRHRLDVDEKTGSLIITNMKTEDSGLYQLQILSTSGASQKIFKVTVYGLFSVGKDKVPLSLMEGDSVTFKTGVKADQRRTIIWYCNDNRIAQITGDQSQICPDDQCKERFRDRLKLDHQTGSLTITNITTTDSGEYQLNMPTINTNEKDKNFSFSVRDVLAANNTKSAVEGECVTLTPSKYKITKNHIIWDFNDICIAEITEGQSQICTNDQCKKRFKGRLEVGIETGSLTIMNLKTEDSGEYQLLINSSRFSIMRSFTVTAAPGPHEPGCVVAIVVAVFAVVLLLLAIAYIYKLRNQQNEQQNQNNINDEAGQPLQDFN